MSILGQPITGLSLGFGGLSWRFPILIPVEFSLQVAGVSQPQSFLITDNFCQIENTGIQFIVQVLDENLNPLNISGATALTLAFMEPDGTQFTRAAQYLSNGIDGNIYYSSLETDITEEGLWYIQAQFTVGGATLTTLWGQFEANANL